MKKLVLIQWIC